MVTNSFGVIILFGAVLLSLRDIYGHSGDDEAFKKEFDDESTAVEDAVDDDHVEVRQEPNFDSPLHSTLKFPEMKFLFCVSCGYRHAFDEFTKFIHEKYPSMKIDGSNYSPAAWKSILAQVIGFGKIALIVMIVMGQNPFASAGRPTPQIINWALNNKLSSCMMLFLISNTIEGTLMSTGAFEIYLGKERIWSKLESGRVPTPSELIQIIDQHMELQGARVSDTFAFGDFAT